MQSAVVGLDHAEMVKLFPSLQGPSIFPGSQRWVVLRDMISMDTFQFPSKRTGRFINFKGAGSGPVLYISTEKRVF